MNEDEYRKIIAGDFLLSLEAFREVLSQHGIDRAAPGQFSLTAARNFSDDLILAKQIWDVDQLVGENPDGAVSFYEFAHEVEDHYNSGHLKFHDKSSGKHEPFLLLASATRNLIDQRVEDNLLDEQE
jgi:hypothetical protein